MLLHLIEHAQQHGFHEFDFGVGEEGFKQRFATGEKVVCGGACDGFSMAANRLSISVSG